MSENRTYPGVIYLGKATKMILRTPPKNNEIEVECRTGMTSMTFIVDATTTDVDLLITKCNQLDLLHKDIIQRCGDGNEFAWGKLGYCGVMFLGWLASAKRLIEKDPKCDQLIMKMYIKGVKEVDKYLNFETQPEIKSKIQPEIKPKTETKSQPETNVKPQTKTEVKPIVETDTKPQSKIISQSN